MLICRKKLYANERYAGIGGRHAEKGNVTHLKKCINSFSPVGPTANSHLLKHEVEAVPAAAAAVWAKHGMSAQNVHLHNINYIIARRLSAQDVHLHSINYTITQLAACISG